MAFGKSKARRTAAYEEIVVTWQGAANTADPFAREKKLTFLGGALRIYALATGEDEVSIRRHLQAEYPIESIPTVENRYGEIQFRSIKTERPQPHAGAQRPVNPDGSSPFEELPELEASPGSEPT